MAFLRSGRLHSGTYACPPFEIITRRPTLAQETPAASVTIAVWMPSNPLHSRRLGETLRSTALQNLKNEVLPDGKGMSTQAEDERRRDIGRSFWRCLDADQPAAL